MDENEIRCAPNYDKIVEKDRGLLSCSRHSAITSQPHPYEGDRNPNCGCEVDLQEQCNKDPIPKSGDKAMEPLTGFL